MDISRESLSDFLNFVRQYYGVTVVWHSRPPRGQHARFMFGDNIVLVRDHAESTSQVLEVFCSDEDKLRALEQAWGQHVLAQFQESEGGGENGGQTD